MSHSRGPHHIAHRQWPKASARERAGETHKGVFLASSYLWLREFVRQRWLLCVITP